MPPVKNPCVWLPTAALSASGYRVEGGSFLSACQHKLPCIYLINIIYKPVWKYKSFSEKVKIHVADYDWFIVLQILLCHYFWHSCCMSSSALRYTERSAGCRFCVCRSRSAGCLARHHRSAGIVPIGQQLFLRQGIVGVDLCGGLSAVSKNLSNSYHCW